MTGSFFSKVLELFLQGLGVLSPRSWSLFSKVLEFYLQGLRGGGAASLIQQLAALAGYYQSQYQWLAGRPGGLGFVLLVLVIVVNVALSWARELAQPPLLGHRLLRKSEIVLGVV